MFNPESSLIGKNEIEARLVAEKIDLLIESRGSIGVVAFSEEQLSCLWNILSERTQQKLTDRLNDNTAFFKSLENVQGDECDHLIYFFWICS